MPGQESDLVMVIMLVMGGTLSVGGIVMIVADAGSEGMRTWTLFGQQVQSTMVAVGSFVTGLLMMAASTLITAGSNGMLSGSSAAAAIAGDYVPEAEPNDQWARAQPLPDSEPLVGMAEPGDRDRFVVLADPGGPDLQWSLRALPDAGNCELTLRRPGSPVRALAVIEPGDQPRTGTVRPGPGREVFFGVTGEGSSGCRYLFRVDHLQ